MPIKRKALPQPWKPVKKKQSGRLKSNSAFYQAHRWRKHRKIYLSEHPLCVECEKVSKVVEAKVLDHIIPINQGGAEYDYKNHQGLCSSCHNSKSGREAHAS